MLVETVIGTCGDRRPGPSEELPEGFHPLCPQCGAEAEVEVLNNALCTCWDWCGSCPVCGWHGHK